MFETNDGTSIHYEDAGEGPPLLLLHGLTGTGADWGHVFEVDIRTRFRVIAPDARGHGRTTNPSGTFGFVRCAEDVLGLLDHLGIERVRAVGTSLGAKTLLHVATRAPERVEGMVLVSATPRFPEATRAMFRAAAAATQPPEAWDAMRAIHTHGDAAIEALWKLPARLADANEMAFGPEDLARITARVLVVAGDRDPLYPVELAVELYRNIPNAALYVVPKGGHSPIFEDERVAFVSRALAFLDG